MSTATERLISAVAMRGRIELRGPYNLGGLADQLPSCRWDRLRGCWMCAMTPATCWRITTFAANVEVDDEIRRAAHAFYEPVLRPGPERQPEIQRGTAWRHQACAYSFAFDREAALLSMWMGTGKSRVAVNLADNWGVRTVLILCPVAVRGVWRREIAKHSPREWDVLVLESGTVAGKTSKAIMQSAVSTAQGRPLAVVINYESAKLGAFATWSLGVDWDLVICDESHRIKSAGAAVSKYAAKLGRVAARRLCLTGTPMAHSPLDLFGQFRFLDPGVFGTSFHRFSNEFAIAGPLGAHHIVGFKNQDELARRMGLITYEVGPEVLDLPDAQHITVPVTLGAKSRKVYDEMEEDLIAFVEGGGEITAANGLVKLLRLAQITGGHCTTDDGEQVETGAEKREALADLLADVDEPVIVCCRFQRDLDSVRHVAESLGRAYGEISGRCKDLTPESTMPDGVEVMAVQIQAGGVGIDLTRARLCVLYSVGYSLGEYDQFLARVHRPGQSRPVVYYHLVAQNTVDEAVYEALENKRDVVAQVLEYMRGNG